jgi:hypothetical protein
VLARRRRERALGLDREVALVLLDRVPRLLGQPVRLAEVVEQRRVGDQVVRLAQLGDRGGVVAGGLGRRGGVDQRGGLGLAIGGVVGGRGARERADGDQGREHLPHRLHATRGPG